MPPERSHLVSTRDPSVPIAKYFHGKGEQVMKDLVARYGPKKGKSVFYATAQRKNMKAMAQGGVVTADDDFGAVPVEEEDEFGAVPVAGAAKKEDPSVLRGLAGIAEVAIPKARQGAMDLLGGVRAGVAGSLTGLYRGTYNAMRPLMAGAPELPPNSPEVESWVTPPDSAAGRAGKFLEQAGEFMLPGGAVRRGAKAIQGITQGMRGAGALNVAGRAALEGASAAGVRGIQTGGDPEEMEQAGLTAGGISGAMGAATAGIPALRESAKKGYARALGATRDENKLITDRISPELMDRGFKGTRRGMLKRASASAEDVGQQIEAAHDALPKDLAYDMNTLAKQIDDAATDLFTIAGPNGARIPNSDAAERGLSTVQDLKVRLAQASTIDPATKQLMVPHEALLAFRRAWDKMVNAKKGFTTGDLALDASGNAMRETSGVARETLNTANPQIADLNKEYKLWSDTEKVLDATQRRTQSQAKPLSGQLLEAAATGGAISQGPAAIVKARMAAKAYNAIVKSAMWESTSAVYKNRLANLMDSSDWDGAISLMSQLGAGGVSQFACGGVVIPGPPPRRSQGPPPPPPRR